MPTRFSKKKLIKQAFLLGLTSGISLFTHSTVWSQQSASGLSGANVVAGGATIGTNGNVTNITSSSDRTIINWDKFSIKHNEVANFLQPNSNSSVLNRVTSSGNPSAIFGTLNSNGNVFLVNPSGIVVGPQGVINTNGFTASTLDINNKDFIKGFLNFRGNSNASVINHGTINTKTGGAALIANQITNTGTIRSEGGSISLVTGGTVTLSDGSTFTHADMATIEAGVSPYAGVIQNSGTIRATGAVESGGEVYLVNPGGKILHDGTITANKKSSNGVTGGNVSVRSETGKATISGTIAATGLQGGNVVLEGDQVELMGATIDASGSEGGGSVKVGGGFRGEDANITNSSATFVDSSSVIRTDATVSGDGGEVILWSDGTTYFAGTISSNAGANGGNGGFVETSGKEQLGITSSASVSTLAPAGQVGNWLLDPRSVTVSSTGTATIAQIGDATDTTSNLTVAASTLNAATSNVNIVATETITFDASVNITAAGVGLTATAGDSISVNSSITLNNGDLTFKTDDVNIGAAINVGSGGISFLRNSAGRMTVGDDVGVGWNIDDTELAFLTGGSVQFGNSDTGLNNVTRIDLSSADLSGFATSDFHVGTSDLILVTGDNSVLQSNQFQSATFSGGAVIVEDGSELSASGSLDFSVPTVNIGGAITASSGITGSASLVNVLGSTDGTEIQDAIDMAGVIPTINVSTGTYSGFIANKDNIVVVGSGNVQIDGSGTLVTIAANGVAIHNLNLRGTSTAGDTGVLLDGTNSANLTGVTISNVDFTNLEYGVRSTGDIGSGVPNLMDIVIEGSSSNKSTFTDMLESAILIGDDDNDANYLIRNIAIRDGADLDTVSTVDHGIDIRQVGSATIQSSDIRSTNGAGIYFSRQINGNVLIGGLGANDGNHIEGGAQGIRFDISNNNNLTSLVGGTYNIVGNSLIDGVWTGILIHNEVADGATVNIVGNTEISGRDGIIIGGIMSESEVLIAGNETIFGDGIDGIYVREPISESTFIIGNGTANIRGTNQGFSGNTTIEGTSDGINIDSLFDSAFIVRRNSQITGAIDGIELGSRPILSFPKTQITDSDVTIFSNQISASANGVYINSEVRGQSNLTFRENLIGSSTNRIGGAAFLFEEDRGIFDSSTIIIGTGNRTFSDGLAIDVHELQSSETFQIDGGIYDATGGVVRIDNTGVTGTKGIVEVGSAGFFGGDSGVVFHADTNNSSAGLDIRFTGSPTFQDGEDGLVLTGPGIDILDDTFDFSIFSGQSGDYIRLEDGAEFLPGSPTILNANGVSFEGNIGLLMTEAELFAVEDKLTHFPDNNTLGLIDISPLFVVEGESIQTAVNFADNLFGPQTVIVGNGTFGGSVEVWVDNLTLRGQGSTTIIDPTLVDPFANNGDVSTGFQIQASSNVSGNRDPIGITVEGFQFGNPTGNRGQNGVSVNFGQSTAADTMIRDSSFSNLSNGIVVFDGGLDDSMENFTVDNVQMSNLNSRGIFFASRLDSLSSILIQNSSINSQYEAIFVVNFGSNGTIRIAENDLVSRQQSAIRFTDDLIDTDLAIVGNSQIKGGNHGIEFWARSIPGLIENSSIVIAGNDSIDGSLNGIHFENDLANSNLRIGSATVDIRGTNTSFGGNGLIEGNADAIRLQGIQASSFVLIHENEVIEALEGIGIGISRDLRDQSRLYILDNQQILGSMDGISFSSEVPNPTPDIVDSQFVVAGNDTIDAHFRTGIFMGDATNSDIQIGPATVTFDQSQQTFLGNNLIEGEIASVYGRSFTDSTFSIRYNRLVAGIGSGRAAVFIDNELLGNTQFDISNNSIEGAHGIFVRRVIDTSSLEVLDNNIVAHNIGSVAASVGGSGSVLLKGGNFSGGLYGVAFSGESDPGTAELVLDGIHISNTQEFGIAVFNGFEDTFLETTIQNGVTFDSTDSAPSYTGIYYRGPNLSFTGDTLSDTAFIGRNGNFIVFEAGGLFDPGRPTVIDATGVYFDGLSFTSRADLQEIEHRIIHFKDDPTLGLIFPGEPVDSTNLTYDRFTRYEDYFSSISELLPRYGSTIRYQPSAGSVSERLESSNESEANGN